MAGQFEPKIREIRDTDFANILKFADEQIGENYFTAEKLEKIFKASRVGQITTSMALEVNGDIQGIRLTYPPNQWIDRHPEQPIHPHLWQVPLNQVAYFQSLFISREYQGQKWGQQLSMASVERLKMLGAKAVLCHSWDESPGNSSRKYLDRLGFEKVISISNYWQCIDYSCTRCGNPCKCTATEMILYI